MPAADPPGGAPAPAHASLASAEHAGSRPAASLAALGLLLAFVAGMFDAEPLYVPGIAFVTLALGAVGWVRVAARGIVVTRVLGARRVAEDEPLDAILSVRVGGLGVPGGVLLDPLLAAREHEDGEPFDAGLPLPVGKTGRRVRVKARFARRGRRELQAPSVVVRDPLGLAAVEVRGAGTDEVLVLPRVEQVRSLTGAHDDGRARRRGRPAMAAEVELDGVREHRPGTPASRIYWPALARGIGMMERRLRAESDTTPLIVLDTRGASDVELRDELDAAVRAVASLAVSLAREGGVAVLLPGDRRPTLLDETLGGWTHLHARLALVQGGGRPGLANIASRIGAVLYVAARAPGRTPRGLEHAPAAGRVLVVPGTLPNRRPSFSVAGCHGYELEASRMARGRGAAA